MRTVATDLKGLYTVRRELEKDLHKNTQNFEYHDKIYMERSKIFVDEIQKEMLNGPTKSPEAIIRSNRRFIREKRTIAGFKQASRLFESTCEDIRRKLDLINNLATNMNGIFFKLNQSLVNQRLVDETRDTVKMNIDSLLLDAMNSHRDLIYSHDKLEEYESKLNKVHDELSLLDEKRVAVLDAEIEQDILDQLRVRQVQLPRPPQHLLDPLPDPQKA